MTSDEAVNLTRAHFESQFPKVCGNCGVTFGSLRDFALQTSFQGHPISYDEETGDAKPKNPLGIYSFANCACGTTLAVTSDGMSSLMLWRIMTWVRKEARRRGRTWREVAAWIRGEIDRQARSEAGSV
ncbi:MAG: hypothetical protein ACHQ2Z_00525 [Elusimicrobiota bacterium]